MPRTPWARYVAALAIAALACAAPLALPAAASANDRDGDGLTNWFEINRSHTNPDVADTNGDGVIDSAEDPDRDGLSNLGEQRFGTNPRNADTDGDGVPDGADDANANGIPDGREQDMRPVPTYLMPTLANAPKDRPPSYTDGCHVRGDQRVFRHCVYGNAAAKHTVALFGDSHAAQWLPAVIGAAKALGWNVLNLTRSACPSVDVTVWSIYQNGPATWCNDYRRQAIRWLQLHPPDVIILSNLGGTAIYGKNGQPIPAGQVETAWSAGLGRTLDALPASSRTIVLADTPYPGINVPPCLQAHPHSIAACERPRALNMNSAHAAHEAKTAGRHGAAFANLVGQTCSYDPCPVVIGHVVMWTDHSHMTATFSRLLAPSIVRVIKAATGG